MGKEFTYKLIEEIDIGRKDSICLFLRDDGKFVVVAKDYFHNQYRSIMPGDLPRGSGVWIARFTDSGLSYVSNGYSASYAKRKFREFTKDRPQEERGC